MNADNMLQTTGNAFKSPFEDAASCDAASSKEHMNSFLVV